MTSNCVLVAGGAILMMLILIMQLITCEWVNKTYVFRLTCLFFSHVSSLGL